MMSAGKVKKAGAAPKPKPTPAEAAKIKKEMERTKLQVEVRSLVSTLRAAGRTDAQIIEAVRARGIENPERAAELESVLADVMGKDTYAVAVKKLEGAKPASASHPLFPPATVAGTEDTKE